MFQLAHLELVSDEIAPGPMTWALSYFLASFASSFDSTTQSVGFHPRISGSHLSCLLSIFCNSGIFPSLRQYNYRPLSLKAELECKY